MIAFDKDMLSNLVDPVTGGKLVLSQDGEELICEASKLAYPIHDGVPILRYDQAREVYTYEEEDDGI